MNVFYRELLLLGTVFLGVLIFIWFFIAADLPEDFIAKVKASTRQEEEGCDGGLRDHR